MQSDPKVVAETLLCASIREAIPDAVAGVNQQGLIIQVNAQTTDGFASRDESRLHVRVPGRVGEAIELCPVPSGYYFTVTVSSCAPLTT
jgi:hypothetical protein